MPPKGEGTVSLAYQNYYVTGHFDLLGRENKNGPTHSKAVAAELDIGVTDSVGLSIGLPCIASNPQGHRHISWRELKPFPALWTMGPITRPFRISGLKCGVCSSRVRWP